MKYLILEEANVPILYLTENTRKQSLLVFSVVEDENIGQKWCNYL